MNKLKLTLLSFGMGAMILFVGGTLASMQDRSNDKNQTNQNNSNQNRNQNRNSNNRNSNMNSNTNGNMMNSNSDMMMNSNMMNSNMMNSNMMMDSNMMNSNMMMDSNMMMNSNMMNSNSMMNSNTVLTMSDDANALDADFAKMAAMGGQAEIKWAEVAVQRATNKNVKKYAQKMIKDHTKAGKDLEKVASKKSMTLPTTMSDEQMLMLSQLQQAPAADFDKMYIEMSGVQAHQKMERLFQNQIANGTDADLKAFASKVLPTVQMHLKMAQEMSSKGMMNGSMNSNSNMMNSNSMNMNSNSKSKSNSNRKSNSNSNGNSNSNSNDNR